MNYRYKINEEITRWACEVYINTHLEKKWYIAFTNPTAGPWKKINVLDSSGKQIEVYRFDREEKRPDLVLINDSKGVILIVEAKYDYRSLVSNDQMKKSIKVVEDMSTVLREIKIKEWNNRGKYKILTSFLWYTDDFNQTDQEAFEINKLYQSNMPKSLSKHNVNIVVHNVENKLTISFNYNGIFYNDIKDLPL